MKRNFIQSLITTITLFLIVSCSKDDNGSITPPSNQENNQKVLIIGVDGLRPDVLANANTPSLNNLMDNGIYSLQARNEGITMSGPGWSSILSGVWPDKHGVTDNNYSGADFSGFPHVFKRILAEKADERVTSIVHWNPINQYQTSTVNGAVLINASSDNEVARQAENELLYESPIAMFLHFDDTDIVGHESGFEPDNPQYITAIENVDSHIGKVLEALHAREDFEEENWLILVTSDHGGTSTSHGGDTDEERNVLFIASGKDIPTQEIAREVTRDTIPGVENCLGSIYELKFDGENSVQMSNANSGNFGKDQNFSMEARIRSTNPGDVHIVGKKDFNSGANPGYLFTFNTNTDNVKVNIGDGGSGTRVDVDGALIADDNWHMVSATFNRDGDVKLYVDGELKGSAPIDHLGSIDNGLPFSIGMDGNFTWAYEGFVAEVRLFNRLLTDSEINNWQCKVLDNSHPGYNNLVSHWKLDKGEGTTANDSGPAGNDGTISTGLSGGWKDAAIGEILETYDYSNTPRIVDVVNTVLYHLCIPIKESWELDGKSYVEPSCRE